MLILERCATNWLLMLKKLLTMPGAAYVRVSKITFPLFQIGLTTQQYIIQRCSIASPCKAISAKLWLVLRLNILVPWERRTGMYLPFYFVSTTKNSSISISLTSASLWANRTIPMPRLKNVRGVLETMPWLFNSTEKARSPTFSRLRQSAWLSAIPQLLPMLTASLLLEPGVPAVFAN